MALEVKLRKWGNSIGVVLPREIVESKKLKEDEKIIIEIVKVADLSKVFGSLKSKISAQAMKDIARRGWESSSDRKRWKR